MVVLVQKEFLICFQVTCIRNARIADEIQPKCNIIIWGGISCLVFQFVPNVDWGRCRSVVGYLAEACQLGSSQYVGYKNMIDMFWTHDAAQLLISLLLEKLINSPSRFFPFFFLLHFYNTTLIHKIHSEQKPRMYCSKKAFENLRICRTVWKPCMKGGFLTQTRMGCHHLLSKKRWRSSGAALIA